jgi:hypothetical protein
VVVATAVSIVLARSLVIRPFVYNPEYQTLVVPASVMSIQNILDG